MEKNGWQIKIHYLFSQRHYLQEPAIYSPNCHI